MQRLFRFLYAVVRRLSIIDVTQLLHLPPGGDAAANCPDGYAVRLVQRDEWADYLRQENDAADVEESPLCDPRRCLVGVFHDQQIVSFLWIADEAVESCDNYSRSEHLGTSIGMPDGTVFVYNAWTSPDHRGNRLVAVMLRWALHHRVCGARACLTMIDWTNVRSIRAFEFLGMKRLGWIIRIGRRRFQFSLVPRQAKQLGVDVATKAPGLKLAW